MVGTIIDNALSGIATNTRRVATAADNIANAQTPGRGEDINVIEEIVDLKLSSLNFKANVRVLEVASDLTEELLSAFDKED